MIVSLDRQPSLRSRAPIPVTAHETRSVVLGLAPAPTRSTETAWPKWLLSFENANLSVARSGHRRSRRSD